LKDLGSKSFSLLDINRVFCLYYIKNLSGHIWENFYYFTNY